MHAIIHRWSFRGILSLSRLQKVQTEKFAWLNTECIYTRAPGFCELVSPFVIEADQQLVRSDHINCIRSCFYSLVEFVVAVERDDEIPRRSPGRGVAQTNQQAKYGAKAEELEREREKKKCEREREKK